MNFPRKILFVKITRVGVLFYADYEYAIYFGLILRYNDENGQIWIEYLQFYMTHMILLLSQSKQGLFEKNFVAKYTKLEVLQMLRTSSKPMLFLLYACLKHHGITHAKNRFFHPILSQEI